MAGTLKKPVGGRADRQYNRVLRKFVRNRMALFGLIGFTLIVSLALAAPLVSAQSPYKTDLRAIRQAPSDAHLLGTDIAGRDVFTRVLYGARISLLVGVGTITVYGVVGVVLGLIAGFYGGWIDTVIMRISDALMSIPTLLVVLMLVTITERNVTNIIFAIVISRLPGIARLVRGQVLAVKQLEYVTAARAIGASDYRIMAIHLLPNILAPVIVSISFGMASAILAEASLSFLGVGIPPPEPSWGTMLNEARALSVLTEMPWFWIPPGLMTAITVLCINFAGDGLRDALDPRMKDL
ncbi:MAG: ABC transporter permease [Anaerolineae bacterium]|nr:ABC transporter permease [Anaerolineae bacterium]